MQSFPREVNRSEAGMTRKLLFALAAASVGACTSGRTESAEVAVAEPELLASYYGDGEPMWVGTVEQSHLRQSPFDAWYDSGYDSYTPNADAVAALSTLLESVSVEVYFGTWCSDSQQEVPRLNRILDEAGFPHDRLEMIALSDRPGEFKFSPAGKEQERLVHRTPTIVMVRDGREIGRIVQYTAGSLEEDMLAIASGESYVPRFRAEARLHEIVTAGGMDALRGRTTELANEIGALSDTESLWHYARYDLLFNNKPEKAEAVLDVFLQLHSESAQGHVLLAQAHRDLGDLDQALLDVRRALEYDADNEAAKTLEEELERDGAS